MENASNLELESEIRLDRMEDIYDRASGDAGIPHRHSYYTIVWVKRGNGNHIIDFNSYELAEGQIYFIAPGQIHHLVTTERPTGCVITFTRSFLSLNNISENFILQLNLFRPYGDASPLLMDEIHSRRADTLFSLMLDIYETPEKHSSEMLGTLLKAFLLLTNDACRQPLPVEQQQEQGTHILLEFRKLVDEYFNKQHKVNWYAGKLFITPKHLNAVIKNLIDRTAKEYIQDRIILEARRLLLHSEQTVKEVAFALGFHDPLHFSRFFKNCTGQAPSDFRK